MSIDEYKGTCPLCDWCLSDQDIEDCPHFLWMHGEPVDVDGTGIGDTDGRWEALFSAVLDARRECFASLSATCPDTASALLPFTEDDLSLDLGSDYLPALVAGVGGFYGVTNYYTSRMAGSAYKVFWASNLSQCPSKIEEIIQSHIRFFDSIRIARAQSIPS